MSAPLSPVTTGLRGRCVKCGEGSLFAGFLAFAKRCEGCGFDLEIEDAGDGPAVFVIFLAGIFVCPLALAFHIKTNAPIWLTMLVWCPILLAFCMAMLRPLRGLMLNIQIANDAAQGKVDDTESDPLIQAAKDKTP